VILALNAGSSTLKYRLVPGEGGIVEGVPHGAAVEQVLERLSGKTIAAVGHRVVHGGTRFQAPVLVDDAVLKAIRDLSPLAPLHNPAGVAGIEAARRALPGVPQVAVFDTAFHATLPRSLAGLDPLGIAVDPARNGAGDGARIVSPDGARVAVCVVPTDEERAIAHETAELLGLV